MAVLLSLVRLATLLSNIWATYKVLKPAPRSRGRDFPSVRAVATRKRELKACLAVWIVWITWTCAERIADSTVGILIPFYSDIKTVFLAVLYFTRAMVAEPLLLHFIRPTIKPYISTIDTFLELFYLIGEVLIYYASAPWRYWNGSSEGDIDPKPSPPSNGIPPSALVPPSTGELPAGPIEERRGNIRTQLEKPNDVPAIRSEPPIIQIGTRTRRGMEATDEILSPEAFRFSSIIPPTDVDLGSPSVSEEIIVQSSFVPPLLPPPPLPKPMTPAKTPVAKHFPSSVVHPSPCFPGGFALSSTETQSDTGGQTSTTAVQSAVNPTPNSQFSFPEPPPIEMFAPGSFQSSELPRSRLRTITPRTSQAFTAPVPQPVAEPESRPTSRQAAVNRLLASIPSASASIAAESKRGARAAGSSTQRPTATEAQRAPVPAPHKLLSTYPVPEPVVPAAPQPTLKRKLTQSEESKRPVSSATLARRERIASASGVAMPAPGAAKGVSSRSRARKASSAADTSSASTSTSGSTSSTSSRRAGGVAVGKKRSARGNVVESPRVPSAASEVDESDKASTAGSSKKKRRIEDPVTDTPALEAKGHDSERQKEKGKESEKNPVTTSASAAPGPAKANPPAPTAAQARPNDPAVPVDRFTAQAAFGRTAPSVARRRDDYSLDAAFSEAAFGRASSTAPSTTSQNGKSKSPPKATGMNETLDDSSDDESWSAMDEFKTPRHATRTLRSRTVFSDDTNPPPPLPQVLPKPSLAPLKIPPQAPALSAVKSTSTTMFSAISDLVEVDASAAIGAVRGGRGKEDTDTIRSGPLSNAPPIRVSRNAAAAARGIRLRAGARGL